VEGQEECLVCLPISTGCVDRDLERFKIDFMKRHRAVVGSVISLKGTTKVLVHARS
jgi:hypothetical protein